MRDKRYDRVGDRGRNRYGVRRFATMRMKRLWILAAILVVVSGAWAVLFRTNLMPNQRIVVSEFIEDLLAGKRRGRIHGIVSGEDSSTALIDGQAIREGDSIYGVTVVKILPDEVEFEKNGRRWTQGLNETPGREWRGDAEAKAQAKAQADTEAKAQADTEAKAQANAEAKTQADAKTKAQAEAEAQAQADTEAKAQAEAEAQAQADTEAKAQANAEAKTQADAEAQAQADAKAKAQTDAQAKAQAEAKAQAQAEAEDKTKAKAQAEAEARAQEEAEAKAQAEAQARATIEPAGIDEAVQESMEVLRQQPGDEGTQERIAGLIGQLGDKEPSVRDSIVATLVQIGPPAVPLLITAMEDEDWIIRQGASQALGRIGDPQAVEPLINALEDKNQWIRQYAAEALGLIGDERAIEPLVEALEDDNPNVRALAARGLESIRGLADQQEQGHAPDKKQANTIIGKLIDLKIYIGAGTGAVLLLAGLAVASVRRRKRIAEWGSPQHR
ncbi:MAG: HEAT repeat domain-containing protein [Planctomycetota bacterium]